ncbi:MAG TPA: hypothetical protein V6C86_14940 [Oculatellaceae cyanobacterium]
MARFESSATARPLERNRFWWGNIVMSLIGLLFATPATDAWGALNAATGRRIKPGGYYGPTRFSGLRGPSGEGAVSEEAKNPQLARRLWDLSVEMTEIDPGLPPVS